MARNTDAYMGDGDGTIRWSILRQLYGDINSQSYYHSMFSVDLNDYPSTSFRREIIPPDDIIKLGDLMYSLEYFAYCFKATRGTTCEPAEDYGFDKSSYSNRVKIYQRPYGYNSDTGEFGYLSEDTMEDDFFFYNHAPVADMFEDEDIGVERDNVVEETCPALEEDLPPEQCAQESEGSRVRVVHTGAMDSTTKIFNVFLGTPGNPGNFEGYAYLSGFIRVNINANYYPPYNSCHPDEELERRSDYLRIGNIVARPESTYGSGAYPQGFKDEESGTQKIEGVNFKWQLARSTVIGAGGGGSSENDWTGAWSEPEVVEIEII